MSAPIMAVLLRHNSLPAFLQRFPAAAQRERDPGDRHVNVQSLLLR